MRNLPPYAHTLGIVVEGQHLRMPYSDALIGAPGRLHGGTIAGLLEIAANGAVWEAVGDENAVLKQINVTVEYLRAGLPEDVFAQGMIQRLGRRIANVRVEAWQGGRDRLIAAAQVNLLIGR